MIPAMKVPSLGSVRADAGRIRLSRNTDVADIDIFIARGLIHARLKIPRAMLLLPVVL